MGGNLLTIEDEAEREHIKTLIAQGGIPVSPLTKGFWLGIKKNRSPDLYVSHTVGDL